MIRRQNLSDLQQHSNQQWRLASRETYMENILQVWVDQMTGPSPRPAIWWQYSSQALWQAFTLAVAIFMHCGMQSLVMHCGSNWPASLWPAEASIAIAKMSRAALVFFIMAILQFYYLILTSVNFLVRKRRFLWVTYRDRLDGNATISWERNLLFLGFRWLGGKHGEAQTDFMVGN